MRAHLARLRRLRPARGRPAAAAARRLLRPRADIEVTTEALVRVIRRFRPHVMTTYDENGGYPHPDHIMCHTVSMAAFEAAGDPDAHTRTPVSRGSRSRSTTTAHQAAADRAFHEALLAEGLESPYAEWLENWDAAPGADRDHPRALRRLLRAARPGAAGARDAGRPGRRLVPGAAATCSAGVADRGVRGRAVLRARSARRGRPLRRARPTRRRPTRWRRRATSSIAYDGRERTPS